MILPVQGLQAVTTASCGEFMALALKELLNYVNFSKILKKISFSQNHQ